MTDSYRTAIEALVDRDVAAMEVISRPTAPLIRSGSLVPAHAQSAPADFSQRILINNAARGWPGPSITGIFPEDGHRLRWMPG